MRFRSITRSAAIIALLAATTTHGKPQPGIFTGPELTRIFYKIVLPEYPYDARRSSWSGRGTFRAHIAADGKVTRVDVVKSTGHRSMDDVVIAAALRWRAQPGRKMEVDFPMAFVAPPRPPGHTPR